MEATVSPMQNPAFAENYKRIIAELKNCKTYPDKRKILKEMSAIVKPFVDEEIYNNINEAVIDLFYKNGNVTETHTKFDWYKLGFKIKKGVTALPIWARPKNKIDEEQGKPADPEKTERWHPIALLFTNEQVEPFNS